MVDLKIIDDSGSTLDPENWGPTGCTGADMVAQRVLYAMGTPAGSVPGVAGFGTPFTTLAANFRSEFDLYVAFAAAEPALVSSVQLCESSADALANKLGRVTLDRAEVVGTTVSLALTVVAADGSRPTESVDYTYEV